MENNNTNLVTSERRRHHNHSKLVIRRNVFRLLRIFGFPCVNSSHDRTEKDNKARQCNRLCRVKLEKCHIHRFINAAPSYASNLAQAHKYHKYESTDVFYWVKASAEHSFVDTAATHYVIVALVGVIWGNTNVKLIDALI